MNKRRIKRRSAKDKGRNLQNRIAQYISNLLKIPYGHSDDNLIESRLMGQAGTDIILRGEAINLFPYSIEAKSSEKWDVPGAIRQAKRNQKPE
jgi:hypothetical protein